LKWKKNRLFLIFQVKEAKVGEMLNLVKTKSDLNKMIIHRFQICREWILGLELQSEIRTNSLLQVKLFIELRFRLLRINQIQSSILWKRKSSLRNKYKLKSKRERKDSKLFRWKKNKKNMRLWSKLRIQLIKNKEF